MRRFFNALIVVFIVGAFVMPQKAVYAVFTKTGETVTIPSGQTISESAFISGSNVTIEADIDGDLFCAGQHVRITGDINGDIICGAQTIEIDGTVNGNVRVGAQNVNINGVVVRNVNAFGQQVRLSQDGAVDGELLAGGQTVTIAGTVAKNLGLGGQDVTLNGAVGGSAQIASETLSLGDGADIAGNLSYTSENDASLLGGATVSGQIIKHSPPPKPERNGRVIWRPNPSWSWGKYSTALIYIGLGILITLIFPLFSQKVVRTLETRPWSALGVGLLAIIVSPITFFILLITIIGIPGALLFALLMGLALFIARLYPAAFIGKMLLYRLNWNKDSQVWQMVAGILVLWLVFQLPFVGWLFSLAATLFGLGALFLSLKRQ